MDFYSLYKHLKEKGHCDDTIFLVTKPSVPAIPSAILTTILIYWVSLPIPS